MVYLFRFILGFVRFEFHGGFHEDFLNECFERKIDIKQVCLIDGGFSAVCSIKTYKLLHTIAYRHGGKVKIVKKSGLPFILSPLKNRIGFFTGMAVFVFILSLLSCFIWNVEIVGNERLSDMELRTYLEKNNLKSAVMWSSVDKEKLCWKMMSDFEDIAWVHINQNGTTARVEINETRKLPDSKNDDVLKGIDVFRRELEVVTLREQNSMSIKNIKNYKTLLFFGVKIPLYFQREKGDISAVSEKFINVNNINLPIGIVTESEKKLRSSSVMLSDDELLLLAEKRLAIKEEQEFESFEIINRSVEHTIDDDKCVIKGSYIISKRE